MVRFSNSNVAVDDYPRQRDRSPDYLYAGGAAPPSPGAGGPYMTGAMAAPPGYSASTKALPKYRDDPSPPPPTHHQSRDQQSLQIPHWDRYRPRSVPPPMSPNTTEASTIVFPPPRSHSRNHDRDRESYRDRDRRRENKGRQRDRYYDSDHSSSDDDRSNKPVINRSRTPLSKARNVLGSTFSESTAGIGVGVLGAIVGGLAAREASENLGGKGSHGHGHHHGGREALLSTIVGAAVGGLGANAIEKRIEASRRKSGSGSSASSPKAGEGERNYTWGEKGGNKALEDRDRKSSSGRDKDRDTYREREMREREMRERERERDRERRDSGTGTGRSQRSGGKDDYYNRSDDSDDEIVYDYRKRSPRERSRSRRGDDYRGGR